MGYIPTVEEFNEEFPVASWDRNTVADGIWLQKNTIGPLSARDDFLLSLFEDLESGDSWKKWSEKHNSSAEYSAVASAIYIGPNNKISGSGHAYVVGENNNVSATTEETKDYRTGAILSRGGSYVFGMDNYVNDGFVIGNQVTALQGSKVFGRDVSAIGCSTIIGYNASAKEGSLILNTPRDNSHKTYAEAGSIILGTDASAVGGSLIISTPGGTSKNSMNIAGGGSLILGAETGDNYAYAGSIAIGKNLTANSNGLALGTNAKAEYGAVSIGFDRERSNAYAKDGSIAIGNASAMGGSFGLGLKNGENVKANNNGFVIGNKNIFADYLSFVFGYENVSARSCAFSFGNKNIYSYGNAIAMGGDNLYASQCAVVFGSDNSATDGSFAFGKGNSANYGSYSFGFRNIIDHSATNFGEDNSASNMATVFGNSNEVNNNSFNFGNYNTVNEYSINLGNNNSATEESVTFGNNNSANNNSFNFGNTNIVDNHSINFGSENISEKHSVTFGDYNTATTCSFIFGDFNKAKLNVILGLNNNVIASISNNYYVLSAERYSDGKPKLTGDGVSTKTYEPYGFVAGSNNISQTYSPIIIGVANSAALSGGFGELANYDTTGYMVPNYPITIGIGNKAYRNFDTTIGSYNIADGGSNLIFGDWCSAVGNHNTILNGYNSSIMGMDNFIFGSNSKIFLHDKNNNPSIKRNSFEQTSRNILFHSKLNILDDTGEIWSTENILKNSEINVIGNEHESHDNTFLSRNVLNYAFMDIPFDNTTATYNNIFGGKVNIPTNSYTQFHNNNIKFKYYEGPYSGNITATLYTLNILREGNTQITNNNIECYSDTDRDKINLRTFNISARHFNFNDFKYNRSIGLLSDSKIFNVITNDIYANITENNIYQSIFDIKVNVTNPQYKFPTSINNNNLLFTKFICNSDKLKHYNILPRYYITKEWDYSIQDYKDVENLDLYPYSFGNSFVYGGSILNSDRVISFATECSLNKNTEFTTISNSKNIINLGDDNEISASIETVSFGKTNNIVGGHKTTIFGNENIAYITPYTFEDIITDLDSYKTYSGIIDKIPGLYDTNIIGSYNSFMSDVEFDPNEDKHANTIARNFILGYHNDIKVHNFITDNVIIGNNNKTVYETDDYSDQLYRNKIIGNNNSASNQFADCNILGDNNELNNNSEIIFENDTIIGMHNKVEFGSNSTLIGHHNIVSGYNSVLIGEGLSATNSQVVVGRFNEVLPGTDDRNGQTTTSGALFIVGNGSHNNDDFDNPTRSNAIVVSADGTVSARTYKADPGTPLGKLFDFLATATLEAGNLRWTGSEWTIQQ